MLSPCYALARYVAPHDAFGDTLILSLSYFCLIGLVLAVMSLGFTLSFMYFDPNR